MPVILFAKNLSFTYFCFIFGQAAKYSKLSVTIGNDNDISSEYWIEFLQNNKRINI